jgi:hypothetical protein
MVLVYSTVVRGAPIAFACALVLVPRLGSAQAAPGVARLGDEVAPRSASATSGADARVSEPGGNEEAASTHGEGAGHPDHTEPGGVHSKHEGGHHRFHIRFMGMTGAGIVGSEAGFVGGGGLALEVILISGWLELELGVTGLSAERGFEYVADLYAIKPFHVNSWFHPFVGLGLSGAAFRFPVDATATEPAGVEAGFMFGPSATVGIDFWLNRRIALFVRADYTLYFLRPMQTHEIVGAFGFVLGF